MTSHSTKHTITLQMSEELGSYSKKFISDIPMDVNSEYYTYYKTRLYKYPLEGVYIYSFEHGKMLYADGWENVAGIPDTEITMLRIVNMTSPEYAPFVHEINDKALQFLHVRNKQLKEYSFTIETKIRNRNEIDIPVVARVAVHDTFDDGTLKSIIGRFQVDYGLRFGKIMRYAAYGPEKDEFERNLNRNLFYPYRISDVELEVIRLLAKGHTYREIGNEINESISHIERTIDSLLERFKVNNTTSLVSFCYENRLLP